MSDLIYLLITLGVFAGLALLVGLLDRLLGEPDDQPQAPARTAADEPVSTADHAGAHP